MEIFWRRMSLINQIKKMLITGESFLSRYRRQINGKFIYYTIHSGNTYFYIVYSLSEKKYGPFIRLENNQLASYPIHKTNTIPVIIVDEDTILEELIKRMEKRVRINNRL